MKKKTFIGIGVLALSLSFAAGTLIHNNKEVAVADAQEAPYIYGFEEENYPNGCTLTLKTSNGSSGEWLKADSPYGNYSSTGTTGDTLQLYHPHYSGDYGADDTPAETDGWYKVGNIEPVHIMSLYYDYNHDGQGDSEAMFDGLVYVNRYSSYNYFYIGNLKNTNHYAIAKQRGIWRIQVIGQYKFPETASRYPGQTLWINALYNPGLELLTSENATPEASEHINYSFYHNNLHSNIAEIKAHHHNGGVQFHAKLGENVRSLAVGCQNTFGTAQYYTQGFYPIEDIGNHFGFYPQQEVKCNPTTSNAEYISAVLAPRNATIEQYAQSAAFVFVNDTPTDYVSIGRQADVKCYENNHVTADYYEKGTLNGDADSVIANYLLYKDQAYEGDEKITYASWVNRNPGDSIDFTVKLGAAWKFLPGLPTYHEHDWHYAANGDTITASCSNDDCNVTDGLTLKLKAPAGNMTFNGDPKEATFEEGYSTEAFPNPQIKYYKDNAEVAECVKVGKYTAKVTFGNATASVEFEIIGAEVTDPNNPDVTVEVDDEVIPDNIELRVEVRTDVAEKDIAEDYAKIKQMLEKNEKIASVYDVKLVQIVGGVETVIQPSDIKPGLIITVRMAIPNSINMSKARILHIHSADEMEFVSDYSVDGNDLVFKVSKLSEFAFITKGAAGGGASHGFCIGVILLIINILITLVAALYVLLRLNVYKKIIKNNAKVDEFKEKMTSKEVLLTFIATCALLANFILDLIVLIVHTCPLTIVSFIIGVLLVGGMMFWYIRTRRKGEMTPFEEKSVGKVFKKKVNKNN